MKKTALYAFCFFSAIAITGTALAQTPMVFAGPDGAQWTVTGGGNGAPVSALHLAPGAAQACPEHRVRFVEVDPKVGPTMSKQQKFRGDKRWHIECDRSTPPAPPPANAALPSASQPGNPGVSQLTPEQLARLQQLLQQAQPQQPVGPQQPGQTLQAHFQRL